MACRQTKEILLPIFQSLADAVSRFPDVDVVVNFSSFRSVYESTMDVLGHKQIRTVAIIAEGVPERQTRLLIQDARSRGVTIIGPATVGGIKPGCFRIGNTGGMLDNILASRLYRPGSVAYVARSGGMSNELNNIISLNSDGVYEGIAIGGDKYPAPPSWTTSCATRTTPTSSTCSSSSAPPPTAPPATATDGTADANPPSLEARTVLLPCFAVVCADHGGAGRGGWSGGVRHLPPHRRGSPQQADRGLVHRHVR